MPDQTTHPSPEELSAFDLGQLPPETAAVVEDHISECESCCETLLGLGSHDTFVDLLKEARRSSDDESANPTFVTGTDARRKDNHTTVPETLSEHSRYEIVRLIGKGGMGDVFEARHRMMDRTVALKVINHEFIRKPQAVDRFHREVKAAARLSHPNIVTAYDAEQAGDQHFLVMEYVDGIDLANLVKDRGSLPVAEACEFTRQAAVGLQHAHEQAMVHRDIKPHNLMVTADGTVKILDFGLASLAPEVLPEEEGMDLPGELTAAGAIIGTPDFISPEQAQDAHQADIRSDIYSLGATLYYLLSGRAPFADASVIEKLKHHAEQEPVPLENLQIEIPDELADVIRRMMAKDPEQRYQTPQEVADALAPFVDEHRTAVAEQPRVTPKYRGAGRRGWSWAITGLAAVFIALAGIIYVETDKGTLVIDSVDDNVEITIGRPVSDTEDGLEVKVVDRVTGSEVVRLPSGSYRLLMGKGDETNVNIDVNSLQLSREQFTLSRGGKVIVRITRKPSKSGAAESTPGVVDVEQKGSNRSSKTSQEITEVGRFERHGRFAYNAVVSPDGKYAVSCGGYRTIQVWDLETQQEIRVLLGHKGAIAGLAVSATGQFLASGDKSGMIRLWNLPTGEHLGTLTGHNGFVSALAFLPDGRLLSAASDKTLRIWDVHQQKLLRTIELGANVEKMEPLWDNRHVMLSGADTGMLRPAHTGEWGVVKYDLEKGETLDPQPSAQSCLAVANDRRTTLIGTVTGMLSVYDEESGKLIVQMTDPRVRAARDAAILPGNRYAITTTRDGQMHLWDLVEGKLISSVTAISIGTVSLSPDGRYALTFGRAAVGITVWRLPDSVLPKPVGSPLSLIRTTAIKHYGQVLAMDFSADSKRIITGDGSKGRRLIRMFDTKAGWKFAEFEGLRDTARAISASPDGKIIAVGDMDSTIHLLDAKSLEEIDTIDAHGGWVECLKFSPDSRRLASGSTSWGGDEEVSVRVWDIASQTELWRQDHAIEGSRGSVESLCFSPNGTQLVTAHFAPEQRISIWNTETGELIRSFGGPDSQINCVRFSPDGRLIATAHRARKMLNNQWNDPESCIIRLYDATSGEELQQLRGHQGPVLAIEFTPDGKFLVSGGGAGFVDETGVERPASEYSVRFWDVSTGEQVLLQQMSKPVVTLSLSPDGSQLATSAGFNKSPSEVQLWRINHILKQPDSKIPSAEEAGYQLNDFDLAAFDPAADYPTLAPFDALRWEDSRLNARMQGTWYQLQEIDGVPVESILAACRRIDEDIWLERFAEDLVQVMSLMGHRPGRTVDLKVLSQEGKSILLEDIPMTDENRDKLRKAKLPTPDYCLQFNGDYSGVSLPVPSDGSHPLTIECTARLQNSDDRQVLIGNLTSGRFLLYLNPQQKMRVEFWVKTGGLHEPIVRSQAPIPFGETVHIAAVLFEDEIRLFLNGKLQETQKLPVNDRLKSFKTLSLGGLPASDPPEVFGSTVLGLIDEVRISKVARYDKDFTPAERFENDEDTMALYHFDEDSRRTVRDSSGNQRDGENFRAKWVQWPESVSSKKPSRNMCVIRSYTGHEGYISGLATARDGKTLVSGSRDGTVRVWNVADGTTSHTFEVPGEYPARVAVSPNGMYVAASTHGRKVYLWRTSDEQLIRTLEQQTMAIAFVDDEHLLTGDAQDFAGKLWQVESGELIREFKGHTKGIYFYSLTPDAGQVLTKGNDRKWCVWDVSTGEKLHELQWPDRTQDGTYPVLAADARHALTGHSRGQVGMIYVDLKTGEHLRDFPDRHSERVNVVALSPDERFALSGDYDAHICLSDLKTGELIDSNTDHTSGISGLIFLPDGKHFISSAGGSRWDNKTKKMIPGLDFTIRLWQLPEAVWMQRDRDVIR